MKSIDKLERKYGKYGGINNLTLYVIICYVIGYIISIVNSRASLPGFYIKS